MTFELTVTFNIFPYCFFIPKLLSLRSDSFSAGYRTSLTNIFFGVDQLVTNCQFSLICEHFYFIFCPEGDFQCTQKSQLAGFFLKSIVLLSCDLDCSGEKQKTTFLILYRTCLFSPTAFKFFLLLFRGFVLFNLRFYSVLM